jgi:hypothetical protein
MNLIDKKTVLNYFNAPAPEELKRWCEEKGYYGVNPVESFDDVDHVLAAALWYAKTKYSEANYDIASFAGLVSYLATGMYGGFGTENYTKERQAERIVVALAGGEEGIDGIGWMPEQVIQGTPSEEFTIKVLRFLEEFYFVDEVKAIEEIIKTVDDTTVAKIILALANTPKEYQELVTVADKFLKKKESISSLRNAVKEIFKKN